MLINRQDSIVSGLNTALQFAGAYKVLVTPVGAIVSATTAGRDLTVFSSGSFEPGDKILIWRPATFTLIEFTDPIESIVDVNTIRFPLGSVVPVQLYDRLINLCQDGGSSSPQWDDSRVGIYADPVKTTRIPYSLVTTGADDGGFQYYHECDGRVWECILDPNNSIVGLLEGFGGDPSRLNVEDFGAKDDLTKATNAVNRVKGAYQTLYNPNA